MTETKLISIKHLHLDPPLSVASYLLTGDGDPLEAVLAHQILKSQLELHLTLGGAAWIGCTVGNGDLL